MRAGKEKLMPSTMAGWKPGLAVWQPFRPPEESWLEWIQDQTDLSNSELLSLGRHPPTKVAIRANIYDRIYALTLLNTRNHPFCRTRFGVHAWLCLR